MMKKNIKFDKEIVNFIQRIDVNSLSIEVDIEELKLLAKNTKNMNMAFMNKLKRWQSINKQQFNLE